MRAWTAPSGFPIVKAFQRSYLMTLRLQNHGSTQFLPTQRIVFTGCVPHIRVRTAVWTFSCKVMPRYAVCNAFSPGDFKWQSLFAKKSLVHVQMFLPSASWVLQTSPLFCTGGKVCKRCCEYLSQSNLAQAWTTAWCDLFFADQCKEQSLRFFFRRGKKPESWSTFQSCPTTDRYYFNEQISSSKGTGSRQTLFNPIQLT